MQIDPTVIPDAAVERLANSSFFLPDTWLIRTAYKSRMTSAAALLREIIPLLAVPVEHEEDC